MNASYAPGSDTPRRGGNGGAHFEAHESLHERHGASDTPVEPSGAPIGSLLRRLAEDIPDLMVKELALARAELNQALHATRAGVAAMVTGGAVLMTGLLVLALSAVYGLSNVVAPWLAALIVGGVVLVIGIGMVVAGRKRLEPAAFRPDRTMHQLHEDKRTAHSLASRRRTA